MANYYVSQDDGDNAYNGLYPTFLGGSDGPWLTIAKVNSMMGSFNPGDRISFNRGNTFTDATLSITCEGTSGNPITFGEYGTGNKPVFNRTSVCIQLGAANLDYLTIENIRLTGCTGTNTALICAQDNTTNIIIDGVDVDTVAWNAMYLIKIDTYTVKNCTIHGCKAGIMVYGSSTYKITNGLIDNCLVYDVTTGDGQDGIMIHPSDSNDDVGPNHIISNCECYNCGEQGFDITGGSNILLTKNISHDNAVGGISVGQLNAGVIIEKHYSYNETNAALIFNKCAGTITLRYSIIYNPTMAVINIGEEGPFIFNCYNNALIAGDRATRNTIRIFALAEGSTLTFKNNIITSLLDAGNRLVEFRQATTPGNTNATFDHNCYYNPNGESGKFYVYPSIYSFTTWKSTFSQDTNSQFADPKLVNPGADFHLQSDSPCINAGVDVGLTEDYDGNPIIGNPDIGAFEFQGLEGVAVISGGGSLLLDGLKNGIGEPVISGGGLLLAGGLKKGAGESLVSGTGALAVVGLSGTPAQAIISGNGSLIATGLKEAIIKAMLSSSGMLIATGERRSAIKLGPPGEEIPLPKGCRVEAPIEKTKQISKAMMSDGSYRYGFGKCDFVRSLAWKPLPFDQAKILENLSDLDQTLNFQNGYEEETWYEVVVNSYSRNPVMVNGVEMYEVTMEIEGVI